ncbi:unnamed protein product [Phytomonas sp. Hart1]|nr:unnamed protein product [Phytomonas sp. Hart1]|eukprot:CCW68110.1 unnamed protein product [Phytomonas sp. isolate Hart1]
MNKQKACGGLPASSAAPQITLKSHVVKSIPSRLKSARQKKCIELYKSNPIDIACSNCTTSSSMDAFHGTFLNPNECMNISDTALQSSPLKCQNSQPESPRDVLNKTYMRTRDRRTIKDNNNPADDSSRNHKISHNSSELLDNSNSVLRRYSSSSSCDSMCLRTYNVHPSSIFSTSSDEDVEESMFIPEPIIQLSSRLLKLAMPYHTIEQLTPGKHVWVVDEEDVEMFIPSTWCNAYKLVCNGRLSGTVVRHSGSMTIVRFHDEASEISLSLTLPRPCLSIKPVEPYEISSSANKGVFGSCCCKTGPRVICPELGSLKNSLSKTPHQFYESMSVLEVPAERLADLGETQSLFQREQYTTALAMVNRLIATQSPGMPMDVDALTLRSRIFIFLGRYEDALVDALCCAELEPRWVRGYLCMARAHSGLGNFNKAAAALCKASAFLPNSAELECIKDLNSYMIRVQKLLQEVSNGDLLVTLDFMYSKRIIIQSQSVTPSKSLFLENAPILAMHSLFGNQFVGRCEVCFRDVSEDMDAASINTFTSLQTNCTSSPLSDIRYEIDSTTPKCADLLEAPITSPSKSTGLFCSQYCQIRSMLYSGLEEKHKEGLKQVKELLYEKASQMKDMRTLEMMNMTTRLFFMVISTHRRLIYYHRNRCKHRNGGTDPSNFQGSDDFHKYRGIARVSPILLNSLEDKTQAGIENFISSPNTDHTPEFRGMLRGTTTKALPIELTLKLLGAYPLVNDYLTSSQRAELITLYDVLTVKFKEESKKLYTETLFCSLYNYVKCYFAPVYISPSSTVISPPMVPFLDKGETVATPRCTSNVYYVYYLPLLLGCAACEVAPGAEEGAHSPPRPSPESPVRANAKLRFVEWHRSLLHASRRNLKFATVQANLASLASSASGEEGGGGARETLFPLLEAIALRPIRHCEPLTYPSMSPNGDFH